MDVETKQQQLARLDKAIDSITARGGTNISKAMKQGAKLLKALPHVPDRSRRIFLFSDGHPNAGRTKTHELGGLSNRFLKEADIHTSSYGIGVSFNEQMMQAISDNGGGDYFFVQAAEDIPDAVQNGIKAVSSLVGTDAVLQVEPLADDDDVDEDAGHDRERTRSEEEKNPSVWHCQVERIYGQQQNDNNSLTLGDIRLRGMMQVLVMLKIDGPPKEVALDTCAKVATFRLNLRSLVDEMPSTHLVELKLRLVGHDQVPDPVNEDVESVWKCKLAANLDAQILKLLEEKKIDEALDMKREALRLLEEAAQVDKVGMAKILFLKGREMFTSLREERLKSTGGGSATVSLQIKKEAHYASYSGQYVDLSYAYV